MTNSPDLLRSLALYIHHDTEFRDDGPLPSVDDLVLRLDAFDLDKTIDSSGYLAIRYRILLGEYRQLEMFDDPIDEVLGSLARAASDAGHWHRVDRDLGPLQDFLYDSAHADAIGKVLIDVILDGTESMRRQIPQGDLAEQLARSGFDEQAVERVELDGLLDVATDLALISGSEEIRRKLTGALSELQFPPSPNVAAPHVRRTAFVRQCLAIELFAASDRDPVGFKTRMQRDRADLHLGRYGFLDRYLFLSAQRNSETGQKNPAGAADTEEPSTPAARLTFTILPDDQGVAGFVTERVQFHAQRPSGSRFIADRNRTEVLSRLAAWVGLQHCTLYRGDITTDTYPLNEENITEDYLVLVIDTATGQNAVAISPARGRHATFLVRHDVSPLPWREVFALPKRSAKDLGARRMRFQQRWPMDEYEAMFQKVTTALTCAPERFHDKFDYSEDLQRYLL